MNIGAGTNRILCSSETHTYGCNPADQNKTRALDVTCSDESVDTDEHLRCSPVDDAFAACCGDVFGGGDPVSLGEEEADGNEEADADGC